MQEESPQLKPQPSPQPSQFDDSDDDEEIVMGTSRGVSSASVPKMFASSSMKLRSFDEQDVLPEVNGKVSPPISSTQKANPITNAWKKEPIKQTIHVEHNVLMDEKKPGVADKSGKKEPMQPPQVTREESKHFLSLLTKSKGDDVKSKYLDSKNVSVVNDGSLPVDPFRERIIKSVEEHAVTVIRGDTGCGKSSRVPQFLVDASASNRVVVAQPRRLSAVALARRVATERNENCGGSVGFRVGQVTLSPPFSLRCS